MIAVRIIILVVRNSSNNGEIKKIEKTTERRDSN